MPWLLRVGNPEAVQSGREAKQITKESLKIVQSNKGCNPGDIPQEEKTVSRQGKKRVSKPSTWVNNTQQHNPIQQMTDANAGAAKTSFWI